MNYKIMSPGTLLLCAITFICSYQSYAQENSDDSYKRFGFIAGMNISDMNFNKGVPRPSVPVAATWKSGITIGFLVHIPLAENLFIQPGYSYTQRRGADKSTGINYSTGYFSMPVLLKYKISSRFAFVAGPQAELLIYANADSNGVKSNITHDVEERSIGATAGFDIQLIKSFFISARYLQGLNHIGIGQRSDVKEFKYEVVNLSIGIGF